jgi:hypothetical protein
MKLFLLDVYDNGKQIYLNGRDEDGVAHVIRIENLKRTLYYVFSSSIQTTDNASGIVASYLQRIGVENLQSISLYTKKMGFIDPDTREMVPSRVVVQAIFDRHQFFNLSKKSNVDRLPKVIDHVIGRDLSAIEYLLCFRKLKGWFEFNENSPLVKKIPSNGVYAKREQYSVANPTVFRPMMSQPPTPNLLTFAIYQNTLTSSFAVVSNDGSVCADNLTESGVNELIAKNNPGIVCVHDFSALSPSIVIRDALMDPKNTKRIDQLVVDTFAYARELKPMKKDYSLTGLMPLPDDEIDDIERAQSILKLANEMGVIELIFQISIRTGQPCSKVPSRMGRVEWMLLNRFIECQCIPPDKMPYGMAKTKSKESYTGGFVLEPKCGIYEDPVILVDFRSLYPSLCVEYGICYSSDGKIISVVLKDLIDTRKSLKEQAESCLKTFIMCTALKLLANATYGVLACPWSRFYSVVIAKRITSLGREQLNKTANIVRTHLQLDPIYGDTDSLFVATGSGTTQEECDAYALSIITMINGQYSYLELEYEASFNCLAMFGKKHYAGLKRNKNGNVTQEIKGLDLIKRGFSPLGSKISREIVDRILNKEHETETEALQLYCDLLKNTVTVLREGDVPLIDVVITTELSRNLSDYKDTAGLYHVQAALKQQSSASARSLQKGDFVKFVMTDDTVPILYDPVYRDTKIHDLPFTVDVKWYVRQIVSMVDRLLVIYPSYNLLMIQEAISEDNINIKRTKKPTLVPSSSSSSSSSSSLTISKIMHPSAYIKRRRVVNLRCQNCDVKSKYPGFYNLEASALNISRQEPDNHAHVTPKMLAKWIPANVKQCQKCETDYDFRYLIDILSEEKRDALLLNINLRRIVRQYTCGGCQLAIFRFLKKQGYLEYFSEFAP